MELRDFISFSWGRRRVLLACTLLAGLLGFLGAHLVPPQYEALLDIYIYRLPVYSDKDYSYEGYYTQQSSKEMADTVVGLLKSISVSQKAFEISTGSSPSSQAVLKLSEKVQARVVANGLVRVSVKRGTSEEAARVELALVEASLFHLKNSLGVQADLLRIEPLGAPLTKELRASPYLVGFSLALATLMGVLTLLSFKAYLNNSWKK